MAAVLAIGMVAGSGVAPEPAGAATMACGGRPARWASPVIPYRLPLSFDQTQRNAAVRAMAGWSNATNVEFRAGSGGVVWRAVDLGPTGPVAYARPTFAADRSLCRIESAEVVYNSRLTAGYTEAKLQAIATHELGHVLGLLHVDVTPGSFTLCRPRTIMYASIGDFWNSVCRWNTPQELDVAEVDALYPTPAPLARPAPPPASK